MSRKSKVKQNWEILNDKLNIDSELKENGFYKIKYVDMKKVIPDIKPRLLVKQDKPSQLPDFLKNGGVIAISNEEALVYCYDFFLTLPKRITEKYITVKKKYPLIDPWNCTNEQSVIACVELLGEDGIPTLNNFLNENEVISISSGKKRISKPFTMTLEVPSVMGGTEDFRVESPQIESDAIELGEKCIYTLEAKIDAKVVHLRQLYYPWIDMKMRLADDPKHKSTDVKWIILNYVKGRFDLHVGTFSDEADIYSWKFEKSISYYFIKEEKLDIEYIDSRRYNTVEEAPFPQADNKSLVYYTVDLINRGYDKLQWVEEIEYAERQFDLYVNAGVFLGLLEGKPSKVNVTKLGKHFLKMKLEEKDDLMRSILSSNEVFRTTAKLKPEKMAIEQIATLICKNRKEFQEGASTPPRRARTVKSWLISLGLHR